MSIYVLCVTANNSADYIMLKFTAMMTECSYDYLFIYDGNSYSDPMLGSYSGNTIPDTVIATSGHVSWHLYIGGTPYPTQL